MILRKRLFFALWPDDLVRQKCVKLIQDINQQTVRVVAPANLHVTLLFLGYISAEQEFAIRQEAAKIHVPKIALYFNQLSYWKKPGVFCLTATEIGTELTTLVRNLTIAAEHLNIITDKRPYKPHVTLAKTAGDIKVKGFKPITWISGSFSLVESTSQSGQSYYRIIEQWGYQ